MSIAIRRDEEIAPSCHGVSKSFVISGEQNIWRMFCALPVRGEVFAALRTCRWRFPAGRSWAFLVATALGRARCCGYWAVYINPPAALSTCVARYAACSRWADSATESCRAASMPRAI